MVVSPTSVMVGGAGGPGKVEGSGVRWNITSEFIGAVGGRGHVKSGRYTSGAWELSCGFLVSIVGGISKEMISFGVFLPV